tara:strand:- start:211 stop:588 length:378 start_codon:yes stop_codon:yes gene_type:complete
MIAGGTGITPMIQIIRAVLRNENDPTKLSLLFANKEEKDIILRDKLENPDRDFSDRFEVHYTLDKAKDGWLGFTGFIDEEMIRNTMPEPSEETLILLCGPPKMNSEAVKPALESIGYSPDSIFNF